MPVFPELITGRKDGVEPGRWTVEEGVAQRGGAWCNVGERIMSVPLESTDAARLVRAHELMHARVSPLGDVMARALETATSGAMEAAEELRVNTLVARLGFDMEHLQDGSEATAALAFAKAGDWSTAVRSFATVMNTGSEAAVLRAFRKGRPEWSKAITVLKKALSERLVESASVMASTRIDDTGMPEGFARVTIPIAVVLDTLSGAAIPKDAAELRALKNSLKVGGRRPKTGRYAPLVWLPPENAGEPWEARGRGRKHTRASADGSVMRYPQRLLTDPQRRAFVRRSAAPGGVVVIDQSGSMDLDSEEIHSLVKRFPSALVIGYSHRPGSLGTIPNAWIVASNGRVRSSIPEGNIGNGVDGPILEFALSQRHPGETVVWVCDGQVTDSNDHPGEELTNEVALLVRRGAIRMVKDIGDVPKALHPGGAQSLASMDTFGRVGKALKAMSDRPPAAAHRVLPALPSLGGEHAPAAGLSDLSRGGVVL